MTNILWIIGVILFYCFEIFVFYIADKDINNMMRMFRIELSITIPISILLWIYESYKMSDWNILLDKYSIIYFCFLIYNILILWLVGYIYKRKERKKSITLQYYRKCNDYFSLENIAFRVLTFSFTTVFAGTIWIAYSIISKYN